MTTMSEDKKAALAEIKAKAEAYKQPLLVALGKLEARINLLEGIRKQADAYHAKLGELRTILGV